MARTPVLLALLLATPAALAAWTVDGSTEPDTAFDQSGHAFLAPDTDPNPALQQVYFNVVLHVDKLGLNPNQAALGSRLFPPTDVDFTGYLGIWKDCNDDGYVGAAMGALVAYDAALLPSAAICPEGSAHRYAGYVYEFRWIATEPEAFVEAEFVDAAARVWGDYGAPGADAHARTDCDVAQRDTLADLAADPTKGTFASTGGMFRYADCYTGRVGAAAINAFDPTGQLAFDDPEHPERSDSVLNQRLPINLFGDPNGPDGYEPGVWDGEGQQGASFTVWDCDAPDGTYAARDPTGLLPDEMNTQTAIDLVYDAYDAHLAAPVAMVDAVWPGDLSGLGRRPEVQRRVLHADETGTYHLSPPTNMPLRLPATAPSTGDLVQGNHHAAVLALERGLPTSGCGTEGVGTGLLVILGEPVEVDERAPGVQLAKRWTDVRLQWDGGVAPRVPPMTLDLLPGTLPPVSIPHVPQGGGADVSGGDAVLYHAGPQWQNQAWESPQPLLVERSTLTPSPPRYMTWYAALGPAATASLRLPQHGTYGSDWCGTAQSGIVNDFDCDASHWWNPSYDPSVPRARVPNDVDPGTRYHLRDVDCYDQAVGAGTPTLAGLTDGPACARPTG